MKRTALTIAAVALGSLAFGAPASAASGHFAGVYPSHEAAHAACDAGKQQGRWSSCAFSLKGPDASQIEMWVWL
ncbi:hypothetical protein [Saccharopolyspora sp. CA-218241]|uniref:hypothetical protein n=1 Tax=Saccharopolyspora sp. CA-218241 TaxID=3240027 RepID=UPI003D978623